MQTKTQDVMRDFANFANAMNRAFTRSQAYDYARSGGSSASNGSSNDDSNRAANENVNRLPVDVWAEDDAFIITAYLPGVKPEDVEITMEGDDLTIRGRFPQAAEKAQWVKRELFRGAFERRLSVTVPVNVAAIEAVYAQGVLTLRVPKAEVVRPKQIKVIAK